MTDAKIERVQRLYADFGSGNIEAVLAGLTDDIDWQAEAAGHAVPWYGRRHGHAEVGAFFQQLGQACEVTRFQPLAFAANETDVMATIDFDFTVRSTGRKVSMTMHHWWQFRGDRAHRFRGSEDTAQVAAAFAPEAVGAR